MQNKKYGVLSSSINPQELSTTVQAAARVIAGALVFFGVLNVADSTTLLTQVPQIITAVATLVPLGYSLWNSGEVIFGIFRKALVAFSQRS